MAETRSGEQTSQQVGKMGVIEGLQNGSFSLPDGACFNIKNEGASAVELSVQLAGMKDGEFITTRFDPGWNPEIVRVVKRSPLAGINLKWGY